MAINKVENLSAGDMDDLADGLVSLDEFDDKGRRKDQGLTARDVLEAGNVPLTVVAVFLGLTGATTPLCIFGISWLIVTLAVRFKK